jgi:hypothetical protein
MEVFIGIPDEWPAQLAFLALRNRVRIHSDNGGHRRPILLFPDGRWCEAR